MRLFVLISILFSFGCASTYPNKDVSGQTFPSVVGQSLDKKSWKIPEDMKGKPTLLLVGYKQNSQFDIDRWLIGLDMTKTKVDIYEIPTIQGMFPRMFKNSIDDGMRSGIPKEIWKAVITVYSDGARVQEFTGNEDGLNARVLLLDREGKIRYFHDRGFSVPELNRLKSELEKIK